MNGNQLFTSYNYAKLFVFDNRFTTKTYTNTTGAIVNLLRGTIMGTILASGLTLPQISSATDGSEMPRGVLAQDYTIPIGGSIPVSICIGGKVVVDGVVFGAGDTLLTPIRTVSTGGGVLGDLLQANTNIYLVPGNDQTFLDNN